MKNLKSLLILFTVLFSAEELFAQTWSNNGTNLYYSSGKVGIGTSTPATLFEIHNGSTTTPSYFRFDPAATNPQFGFVGTTIGSNSALFAVTAKRAAGESVNGGASMFILEYDATNLLPQSAPNKSSLFLRNDDVWNGYFAYSSSNVYDPNGTYIDYQSRIFEINGNTGYKFARTNISTQHADHYRWEFDGAEKMRVNSAGNLLLGNNGKMLIGGSSFLSNGPTFEIQSTSSTYLALESAVNGSNSSELILFSSPQFNEAGLRVGGHGNGIAVPMKFYVGGGAPKLIINTSGQMFMGPPLTSMPEDGILGVNGSIYAKAVKVKLPNASNAFPDFVFDSNYRLASLEFVEKFVKENKHLPEIPSAADVERDGI